MRWLLCSTWWTFRTSSVWSWMVPAPHSHWLFCIPKGTHRSKSLVSVAAFSATHITTILMTSVSVVGASSCLTVPRRTTKFRDVFIKLSWMILNAQPHTCTSKKCFVYSDRIPDHSKIKHVSLAGCKAQNSNVLFDVIDQWASHHVIETINASGCTLTESQREELLRKHKNVSFNLNEKFEESVRVKL